MIDAVIFDLDGTLVDLPIDYEKLFQEFKKIMRTENVRPVVDTVSRVDGSTRKVLFKAWEKAELAVLSKVSLKATGAKIYYEHADKRKALVTLQGKAIVDAILDNFSLCFDFVVTREDALSRGDQLLKAIKQLEVDKRNALFVGNTDGDAVAASEIGCKFLRAK